MKLYKNRYTLTIQDVSELFETENPRLLCRCWLPGFLVRRIYTRFLVEFAEMFNGREVQGLIMDDIYRLKIMNRVNNILWPMSMIILLNDTHPDFRKMYEEIMGRPYRSRDDIKLIIKEIERLKSKLEEAGSPMDKVQASSKLSFEQVIAHTEVMLDRSLDRNMKLYQFKKQYDLAIARAREYERIKQR